MRSKDGTQHQIRFGSRLVRWENCQAVTMVLWTVMWIWLNHLKPNNRSKICKDFIWSFDFKDKVWVVRRYFTRCHFKLKTKRHNWWSRHAGWREISNEKLLSYPPGEAHISIIYATLYCHPEFHVNRFWLKEFWGFETRATRVKRWCSTSSTIALSRDGMKDLRTFMNPRIDSCNLCIRNFLQLYKKTLIFV